MKRIILSLLLAVITVTTFSQSGDITVDVKSSEPVTGLTTIDYNFTGIATRTYDLTVEVSFDNGVGYQPIPEADLSEDISNVSGNGATFSGTIMWNGAASFDNLYSDQTKIKITATPVFLQCGDLVTFTYRGYSVTYGTVVVDYGGSIGEKCWMDRNLGASQVAQSSADILAKGDRFQWGRLDDGHQDFFSTLTSTLSTTDIPGHGEFITIISVPGDWRSGENPNLWQGGVADNNPCPTGWRVPTEAELETERQSWSSNNSAGAFDSPLKLPVAGFRYHFDGLLYGADANGYYWSSTVDGLYSRLLRFDYYGVSMYSLDRARGLSVRCLKDN